ncbi:hypothetical protein Hanom_Chr09g00822761 [Helianthus anomalus]
MLKSNDSFPVVCLLNGLVGEMRVSVKCSLCVAGFGLSVADSGIFGSNTDS